MNAYDSNSFQNLKNLLLRFCPLHGQVIYSVFSLHAEIYLIIGWSSSFTGWEWRSLGCRQPRFKSLAFGRSGVGIYVIEREGSETVAGGQASTEPCFHIDLAWFHRNRDPQFI